MDEVKVKSKDAKKEKVAALSERISKAKSITFVNYHGLTANRIVDLREKIREAGGELLVEKNTLISRALSSNQLPVTGNQLAGPTALIFAYEDEIAPIKEVAISAKVSGSPTFKLGFLDGILLEPKALDELANIPGKAFLQDQLIAGLSSPIYGFVNVLSTNIRNLVYVLDQVANKPSQSG